MKKGKLIIAALSTFVFVFAFSVVSLYAGDIKVVPLNDPSKGQAVAGKICWNPYSQKWEKQIVLYNGVDQPALSHPVWKYVKNLSIPDRKGESPWEDDNTWKLFPIK